MVNAYDGTKRFMIQIKRAFLSCWDKTGLEILAGALHRAGVELISSGGTARFLEEHQIPCQSVEALTGYPAILDGRVKTLHPLIHAAILATDAPSHRKELEQLGAEPIQLVVVNLYPFVEKALEGQLTPDEAVEYIDIGGPTLLRAGAKNHAHVVVLFHPSQYASFLEVFRAGGGSVPAEYSRSQAGQAFFYTSWYDAQICRYLQILSGKGDALLGLMGMHLKQQEVLRYGENPHQKAAVYTPYGQQSFGLGGIQQLGGKALSYNNYVDVAAAYGLVLSYSEVAVAIVKHTNPCGLAIVLDGEGQAGCFQRALEGDPVSAFGGIVAFNRPVEVDTAREMKPMFLECVVAPAFQPEALEILRGKKNLRLLAISPEGWQRDPLEWRSVPGTVLAQEGDIMEEDPTTWTCVTSREPNAQEWADLQFAWKAVKHVKSNAIVLASHGQLLGVGAGQMSRVDAVELAVWKAKQHGHSLEGAVLASDAFFPFPDGVEKAAAAGVSAIVQPGGSIRDRQVIEAAETLNLAMVLTGIRHFKH